MGKPQKIAAQAAFVRKCDEIDTLAEIIAGMVADRFGTDPAAINWGHVGALEHIAGILRKAVEAGQNLTETSERETTP